MKPSNYYAARNAEKRLLASLFCGLSLLCASVMILFAWAKMPVPSIACSVATVFLAFLSSVHREDAKRYKSRLFTQTGKRNIDS